MINKEAFVGGTFDIYDERLFEGRITTEGNVCGCLLKDLTLFDDCGFEKNDFLTNDARIIYRIVELLREKGYAECDELTYMSGLSEEIRNKIDVHLGGWRQINNLIGAVSLKNWDAFADELNKSNVILGLYKKGFNLFSEMTLENGKRIIPVDFFKKLSSAEVVEFYDGTLSALDAKINSSKIVEEGFVEFDADWLKSIERQEAMGISFGNAGVDINGNEISTFPFMSSNLLGLKHGTISAFGAQSGTGKTTYMVTVIMSLIAHGEKAVIVTNESRIAELKTLFMMWVLDRCIGYHNISKRRFIAGKINDEDRKYIAQAKDFWDKHYKKSIKIVALADADASLSAKIIKKHILRDGCTTFLVDTMKLTFSENREDQSWVSLIKDTRELTKVALKYNVIDLLTLQLAPSMENRLWLDVSCLANCRQIKETLSNLILFRKIKPDELNPESKIYIKPFRRRQAPDGTWFDEPYDADPKKPWIVMFVDKSRRGIDAGTDGVAFLCRTDLDHSSFYETARCYPCRKMEYNFK